jgi:hypothetical protein
MSLSLYEKYKKINPYEISMKKTILDHDYIKNIVQPRNDNVSVKNLWKNFAQPDMTAYSQGNVGSKK